MRAALIVHKTGPAVTVQDLGRPGHMAAGVSRGGAADWIAFVEGAALLGQGLDCAALEMAGLGGVFEASEDIRIALTGAPMRADCDGVALAWNASHRVAKGARITVRPAAKGLYGYLSVGGGFATPVILGSRSAHVLARLGETVKAGMRLPIGPDAFPEIVGDFFTPDDRMSGGTLRVLPSVQTDRFTPQTRARFQATPFTRTPRGNRQAVELGFDGAPFGSESSLTILSEPTLAGDIQMTGPGNPYVLLPECQTTGGYPRIGTVIADDLPIVAQAGAGAALRFQFVTHAQAMAVHRTAQMRWGAVKSARRPLVRDPHTIRDLLSYQLVSGVTSGKS